MDYDMGEASDVPAGGSADCERMEVSDSIMRWNVPGIGWRLGSVIALVGGRYLLLSRNEFWLVKPHLLRLHPPRELTEDGDGEATEEITSDLLEMITPGNWRTGRGTVITDEMPEDMDPRDMKYYDGNLICESISAADAKLVAAAPGLLRIILDVVNGRVMVQDLVELVEGLAIRGSTNGQVTGWLKLNVSEYDRSSDDYTFQFEGNVVVKMSGTRLMRLILEGKAEDAMRHHGLMSLRYAVRDGRITSVTP